MVEVLIFKKYDKIEKDLSKGFPFTIENTIFTIAIFIYDFYPSYSPIYT
jgi:hypothetical protein